MTAGPSVSARWPRPTEPMLEKRAALVAFIGNDGAGKTTQAQRLADWLASLGRSTTLHPNESLQPVKAALGALAAASGHASPEAFLGLETSQFLYAVLKWNTMVKVREPLARAGHFVVMDRYAYCHVASVRSQGLRNAPDVEQLFAVFPPPDLTFLIEVTPEVAIERMRARGTEPMSREYLEGHARAYRALEHSADFVVVDGARPPDAVAAEVRAHVRRRFTGLG